MDNEYCCLLNLPKIPAELILPLSEVLTHKTIPVSSGPALDHIYASSETQSELTECVQTLFDEEIISRYLVIKNNLFLHTDSIVGWKFNYVVHTGGINVRTQWFDLNDPTKMVHDVLCNSNNWYKLRVDIPHRVVGVESPRMLIAVRYKNQATTQPKIYKEN